MSIKLEFTVETPDEAMELFSILLKQRANRTALPIKAEAPTPAPTPAQAEVVDYPMLQKAVIKLHGLDKTAAIPIAKGLGRNTFIEMKDSPELIAKAHRLVTGKIRGIENGV